MAKSILNIGSVLKEIKSERKNKEQNNKLNINKERYGRLNFSEV